MNEKWNYSIWKRLLSLSLALLFLLSSFVEAFAGTSLENALNKVHLYVKEGKGQQLLTWKGVIDTDNFAPAIIVYRSEDGNEYPAYCANPNRPGIEDLVAKSYDVDVDKLDTDPHVWGVITNGYPYKTPQELGLSTEYQAYYATKMAVWATVHANYSNLNDWKANGSHNQPVEAAMKNLVAKGKANDVVYATWLAVNPKSQKAEVDSIDSNYYSQEFEIKSNVKIDSFKIVFDGNVPEGVKATNLQNEEQETFSGDTNAIKVLIPKKDGGEQKGTFNVIAKGKLENKAVMFGISHSGKKQDYYVAPIPFYNGDSIGKVTYYADGTTPPPDEPKEPDNPDTPDTPDTPDIPEPGKGLQIVKVKAGTTQGLSGAVFRLTDADGGIIGDYVTDEQGEISIPDLAVGAYYVEEIVAPEGYLLDKNNHKDFVINTVDPVIITFANEEMAELEVKKVDADTGEPLSGASIRVAYDGGSDSYDLYTNDAGTATLSHLKSGTYTVTEITAPDGYLLDTTPQSIKLEAGKKATITVKNKAKPGLLIKKYDEDTGMPLEKAEFSVKKKDGSIVYEGMTDKSGQIKIENLEPDWYTITELAPPKGYLIATESKEVKLEPNKVTEIKFDNRLRPALQIMKIDSQTGKALKGAVFKVVKTEDSTESEYTTDDTGTILLQDLDEAIYTVTEVKAPDGYLLDEQHKDIQLEWGKTKTLVFENKARPALEILKIDEATKKPLAGAKFKVTSTEGNTTSEYVTDNTGKILIENLNAEIYTIEEIVAPDGYLLEEQHKDVELEWGKTKQVVFTNKKRPVLTIKKIDSKTKEPLSGAKFKVTKTEDKTVSEYITDKTGTITIENLDESIYTVEEITAPEGYILEPQHKEIALEWGKNKTLVYEDTRKPTLIITKTNALTYKPIPNTTYKIEYEGQNGDITTLGTYRTDKNGQIILPKVQPGWYIITEIRPAQGFSKPSNILTRKYLAPGENAYTVMNKEENENSVVPPQTNNSNNVIDKIENIFENIIENNNNNQNLNNNTEIKVTSGNHYNLGEEIVNYPLNSIVIKKVDANTSELLDGAAFEVRKVTEDISGNSGTIIGRYTTDNSGVIVITGLEPGGYIIEEVKPPTNYLLSENSQQQAWLKADGTSIVEVTFSNYPYGSILVSKTDALTGKPLANARFKVTTGAGTAAGSSNGEFITNENGEFLVPNLKPGSYVVTELEAPQNYVLDTTPQTVDIGTDGKVYKLSFKNQPVSTLVILKMDSNSKKPLANAEFKVTTSKGDVVGKGNGIFKTDKTGTITIPNLQKGSYIVEEIKSPDGYLLENQSKTIAIDYGKTYTLEFFNKPLASVIIKKFDSENKSPLSGAKFKITKKSGNVIGEYTTDKNGMIQIEELQPGWYTAVEVKAPDGYFLNDTVKDFEIKTGKTVTVEFSNQKLTSLIIKKIDESSGQPLSGAKFYVEKQNGEHIGEYTTDQDGTINIATLSPDWYVIREKLPPDGYLLDETPKTVEVKTNVPTVVTFTNKKLTALQIKKIDETSNEPLSGAKFIVERQNGEKMGEYTTDKAGSISIPELSPDWYVVKEIKSPNGYLLDETPKTVEVKTNVPTVVTFTNKKLTALQIKKVDEISGKPLSGAKFKVTKQSGDVIGEYTTDKDGFINVPTLEPGYYAVSEMKSPDGYLLDETPKTVEIKINTPTIVTFTNKKLTALEIKKVDEKSNEPLSGAKFVIERQNGEQIGEYTTDKAGSINIPELSPDWYVVKEVKSPDGYLLDETPKTVEVKTDIPTIVTFTNKKLTALEIKKVDEKSNEPLSGAKFVVTKQNGERIGEYTTDKAGSISIPELSPDWYVVKEVKSPDGYLLDETPKTVEVKTNIPTTVTFTNKKLTALQIKKVDEISGEPLSGAKFKVTKQSGDVIGEYTTDKDGFINVPTLEPGYYAISEMKSPNGYLLDETPKTVKVKTDIPTIVTFTNKKLTALEIKKVSDSTGEPLSGAKFVVEKQNGEQIGEYTTDKAGSISIPELLPDWYVVKEVKAPDGYLLDETPKTVEVKTNTPTVVTFVNKPLATLQIKKVDAQNNAPLAGAVFKITKQNGELVGEYKTATDGFINVPTLQPGYYTISEMKAPDGYILDETPKTIEIKTNTPTLVTFTNKPLSGLKIIKLDAVTREPLKGVEFTIAKMNGEKVGSYKTDATGMIAVTNLEDGYYTVTETKALEGYISDKEPKTVEIKSGKPTILEVMNEPYPSLVIYKKAGNTGKPLEGVSFLVTKFNGEQIGTYKTDKSGMIVIEGLEKGKYLVKETETVKGYELDTEAKEVDIKYGKRTTLEVVNNPLSSVIIRKIDSVTKQGIYGVTFLLYDEHDNPLGQFVSDNEGYVWLDRELEEGKYKLRELQPADGYLPDDVPRTIYVKAGQTTEITWENTPQKGQIVITKRSADYNALTGLPAGSPLAGASFEVYNMTGNLMDKMVSAENGVAASKLLPTGVYMVKEVSAPRYYAINTKELYAEIRHNGDIVKFEFLDSSIDLNLTIDKKGANQISPGQTIAYELYNIKNQSSAVLENFYIHDRIPTDATRVTKIVTGTYSERLYYNITYKTNYKDYRVLAENLLTKNSYEYSLHPNALGLAAGEYVTDVRLEFTKASPGFQSLENMTVFCEVMPTIPKDYKVVNRADCGGRYGNEWESANTSWTTIVWKQDTPKTPLPKTGW